MVIVMHSALTIETLRIIDAVDKYGSFATAANSLHKVPSALTYTVKKFEERFEVTLFERKGNQVELTEAGKAILKQGRKILSATKELGNTVLEIEPGWESELRIARDTLVPVTELYPMLKEFFNLGRYTNVNMSVEALSGGWDAIVNNSIDICVGVTGESVSECSIDTFPIGVIDYVFVVSPFHPLACLDKTLEKSDLREYTTVAVTDTSRFFNPSDESLCCSKNTLYVPTIEEKIKAISEGLAVGFVPKHLLKKILNQDIILEKQCAFKKPSQTMFIAWDPNSSGKAKQWFIDKLKHHSWDLFE